MALIPAASLTLATSITAAATYHPGAYQWHQVYFPDGLYQGSDLNEADYYTWSEGTVSVSNTRRQLWGSGGRKHQNQG